MQDAPELPSSVAGPRPVSDGAALAIFWLFYSLDHFGDRGADSPPGGPLSHYCTSTREITDAVSALGA